MYGHTTIAGRLGRDPEMRYTPAGKPVTNLSVAVDKHWTSPDGSKQKSTVWFAVSVWGALAEPCQLYLHKGSTVLVAGSISGARPWQGKDGEWKATVDLNASQVVFMDGKQADDAGHAKSADPTAPLSEEDIPF